MKVAIVGGGLAGCAAAFVLKAAEHEVVIYEAGQTIASGASGNSVGLYNPRFGAEWTPQSQYYAAAFERALAVFSQLGGIEFNPSGALHLITDEKKERRFSKMLDSWRFCDTARIVSNIEAGYIAGIKIVHNALYLPSSGSVNPAKLSTAYAEGIEVKFNVRIDDLDALEADVVVLAAGAGFKRFADLDALDLRAVRGQVTMLKADEQSAAIKCHLCYGGYVSNAVNGVHMVGATFQRWLDHSEIMPEDDADNLEKLYTAVPAFPRDLPVAGSWAAVRTAARDHFPVVGHLRGRVYVSTAHGSHGILSSLMAADVLVNMIDNKPQALSQDVIAALCPSRFNA